MSTLLLPCLQAEQKDSVILGNNEATSWHLWIICGGEPPPLLPVQETYIGINLYYVKMLSLFTFMHWRRKWQPTPVFLPGEYQGRRSLVGCGPWFREESDTTEWLCFHFLLSCIGEGNGNPLQCSCLENPRDGGAWLASVYGVVQSRTRLKRLSSSSSKSSMVAQMVKNLPII